ncbi:RNA polymerase sigma factor [Caldibacillus debilis]|uniref:Uncharacterized protein n=1 Tax=Caldibacillus debilis TaxID=301148 RepID=A0A150LCZ8_9BACI|nr:sigma-70 family RNA polymerase sigma factor [Caldibacillus debilis]KYD09642.1 hypothetical protein B4135_3651 [Caldibacillus debilis]
MTRIQDVYQKYFQDVYLLIYRMSGDRHIAEDITSETFLKAIDAIDQFQGNSDIRTWLCQIAKNSYYSYLRKNKRLIYMDQVAEPVSNENIEQEMVLSEAAHRIEQIWRSLKDPYREVFFLRFFAELSFKEIGASFGKSANWACVTYHRARLQIKSELEGRR